MSLFIEKVKEYFQTHSSPNVVAVYVFGSQATGKARADSDVDVAVWMGDAV